MRDERLLRVSAVLYAVGLALHTVDHFRRGLDVVTLHVLWAGNVSTALGVVTVVLVLTRHRLGPAAAVAAGLPVAIGVSAVHLLPAWFGPLSDSFLDGARNVSWMSWTVVTIEVVGAALMALFGWRVWSVATRTAPTTAGRRQAPA